MKAAIKRYVDNSGYEAIGKGFIEDSGEQVSGKAVVTLRIFAVSPKSTTDAPVIRPFFERIIFYNAILLALSLASLAASILLYRKAFTLQEQYNNHDVLLRSTVYYCKKQPSNTNHQLTPNQHHFQKPTSHSQPRNLQARHSHPLKTLSTANHLLPQSMSSTLR